MEIKAILFDLDGTLLPMDQEAFTKAYFKELVCVLSPFGFEPEQIVSAVWAGTKAMVKNDGSLKNREVFWQTFADVVKTDVTEMIKITDNFYLNEFEKVRASVGENPLAKAAVEAAGGSGRKVVLSTNPIFPLVAQKKRVSWVGLSGDEFSLITSYESEGCCKPNPEYFISISERIGVKPEECLVIGNDEYEDMYAATAAGMNCYLVTDWAIRSQEHAFEGNSGTFSEMIEMLKSLDA